MISKLVEQDSELSTQQITESISHLVYRILILSDEDDPIDALDRKAIGCLWLVRTKLMEHCA